jgi:hypothetical protein
MAKAHEIIEKCMLSMILEKYGKLQYYAFLCELYFE